MSLVRENPRLLSSVLPCFASLCANHGFKTQVVATDITCMTDIFSQMHLLQGALNGTNQNHRVLSQNIANVNTPGYKTRRVDFAELLQQLEDGDDSVSEPKTLSVQIKPGLAERVDGNNVELDREISELKKNALVAQAFTQLLASKLSIMRRAISS